MEVNKVKVGTLRVQDMEGDTVGLRLALTNILVRADLRPLGIPPTAILIVRRLVDPLPRRIAPHRRAVRIDAAWEKAAQNALANLYRRAARPGQEAVPANAKAVRFADEGEMVACLALDIGQKQASERWWWRGILQTINWPSSSAASLTQLLCRYATVVPAALHHLAARQQAKTVLTLLSSQQALTVLAAVGRAYELTDFKFSPAMVDMPRATETLSQADLQPEIDKLDRNNRGPKNIANDRATASWPKSRQVAPWPSAWIPPDLPQMQTCLLGVGLSLSNRPAAVRSQSFRQALAAWWTTPTPSTERRPVMPTKDIAQPQARKEVLGAKDMSERQETITQLLEEDAPPSSQSKIASSYSKSVLRLDQQDSDLSGPEDIQAIQAATRPSNPVSLPKTRPTSSDASRRETDAIEPPDPSQISRPTPQPEELPTDRTYDITAVGGSGQSKLPALSSSQVADQVQPDESETDESAVFTLHLEDGIETQLAGIFYLINLMLQLDLPACFEIEWRLASQVGAWGALEALGRGLLAGEREGPAIRLADDPLWTALAHLAGCEPGYLRKVDFVGGDRFQLPTDWPLSADEESGYYWATQGQRVRLWSDAGYLLVDGPWARPPTEGALRSELTDYQGVDAPAALWHSHFDQAPLANLIGPLIAGLNPALQRWLTLALPYIRFRIQQVLGLTAAEASAQAEFLLIRPGRLYVTSTHVDLVMPLEDISVPIRLAGLDRNPGWLPDFGRVVLFHFE